MRKLNNPMPTGGAPFTNEDLNDVFQTEIWAAIQAMLSSYDVDSEGLIISGCVVTLNADNFDMTAGIVYLNGEFMRVDAVTNQTFPKYIKAATPTNVNKTFQDTTSKTFIIEKKAVVSGTVDGSGQEINITSLTDPLDRRLDIVTKFQLDTLEAFVESEIDEVYVDIAANAASKVDKAGDTMTGILTNTAGFRTDPAQPALLTKIVDIGDWNIVSSITKNVAHGLTLNKIRDVSMIIRNDADTNYIPNASIYAAQDTPKILYIDSTNVLLTGTTGLQTTDFDSTSYNRGWLKITYVP